MPEFNDLRSALTFCVDELIPRRHRYIVDILGPREAAEGKRFTVQLVAQDLVKNDGEPGLAMHLPVDLQHPGGQAWLQYFNEHFAERFENVPLGPANTTVVRLSSDREAAERLVMHVLTQTMNYRSDVMLKCTVHDEGAIESSG